MWTVYLLQGILLKSVVQRTLVANLKIWYNLPWRLDKPSTSIIGKIVSSVTSVSFSVGHLCKSSAWVFFASKPLKKSFLYEEIIIPINGNVKLSTFSTVIRAESMKPKSPFSFPSTLSLIFVCCSLSTFSQSESEATLFFFGLENHYFSQIDYKFVRPSWELIFAVFTLAALLFKLSVIRGRRLQRTDTITFNFLLFEFIPVTNLFLRPKADFSILKKIWMLTQDKL